jgi:hypothetical protein
MQTHNIGTIEQLLEMAQLHMMLCSPLNVRVGIVPQDFQAESETSRHHGFPDPTESNESDRIARQPTWTIAPPDPLANLAIASRRIAKHGGQQRDRLFCNGVFIGAGSNRDDDAVFRSGLDVDCIVSDSDASHGAQSASREYCLIVSFNAGQRTVNALQFLHKRSGTKLSAIFRGNDDFEVGGVQYVAPGPASIAIYGRRYQNSWHSSLILSLTETGFAS